MCSLLNGESNVVTGGTNNAEVLKKADAAFTRSFHLPCLVKEYKKEMNYHQRTELS